MNTGSKESLNGLYEMVVNPNTTPERAALIGGNLWTRGLKLVQQRRRIEREMAEAEEKHQRSLKKAARRRVNQRMLARSKKVKSERDY